MYIFRVQSCLSKNAISGSAEYTDKSQSLDLSINKNSDKKDLTNYSIQASDASVSIRLIKSYTEPSKIKDMLFLL